MEKINYNEDLHREIIGMTNCCMQENKCLTIGMKAPAFTADTTFGPCNLSDYSGKWLILFSHPRKFHSNLYDGIHILCKIFFRIYKKKLLSTRTINR